MTIKSERVNVSEIRVGDYVIIWDRAVIVDKVETRTDGVVLTTSEVDGGGYGQFLRYNHENILRLTEDYTGERR